MTTEARPCAETDAMDQTTLYVVQNRGELNIDAGTGVAVREVPTPSAPPANILLLHEQNLSGTFAAARCAKMLPLVVCTIPQGDRTTAC